MLRKEAAARIKINRLLEAVGWRFFDDLNGAANVVLEPNVKLKPEHIESLGEDFEKSAKGFIDFLLLDKDGRPLIVLEAKSEDKDPRIGKEQARKYARAQNARFVILSNGNIHYLWDLEQGNPTVISAFPGPDEIKNHYAFEPNAERLFAEKVERDFIVLTQMPGYASEAAWKNEAERDAFVEKQKLRFLRPYQERAIQEIQKSAKKGATRFLFEMATGTGKTLTSAAVIKLFLKTRNAKRVLFLVDRLELETQADKAFKAYLKNDFTSIIYKEQRDDWRKADIVVTTVQSLLFNDKYRRLFSPTDFDLVISDEAHRSIGGNARAVFEYFIGYKLGLTATPKDYLKQSKNDKPKERDPREAERRMMLDTYRTFGCESGDPTFRYSLLDGVREGLESNLGSVVERALLAEGGDYNLSAERYTATETRVASWDYRAVGDICAKVGESVLPETLQGPIEYIGLENIVSQLGKVTGQTNYADTNEIKSLKTVFLSGDILYGKLRPNLNKVWHADRDGICSTDIFALRADHETVDPAFLAAMLRSSPFNERVMEQLRGAQLPRVGWGDFSAIEIPLPPLEVQREIVAEVEGYQRVIDGARAVLNNYRPYIPVDSEWPVLSMAEIAEFKNGLNFTKGEIGEPIRIVGVSDFQSNTVVPSDSLATIQPDVPVGQDYFLQPGDILFVRSNGNPELVGRSMLAGDDIGCATFSGFTIRARFDSAKANPLYLAHFFKTPVFSEKMKKTGQGANIRNLSQGILAELQVPLPNLDTQTAIVTDIEVEQALVNGNRDLIARFEKKIDAAIARVWSETKVEEAS